MKKLFFVLLATSYFVACKTEDKKSSEQPPLTQEQKEAALKDSSKFTSILWLDSTVLSMGKIKKGAEIEVAYRFKNTGTHPLIFDRVDPQCGCTMSEVPRRPYAPGEEGVIKSKFNSGSQQIGEHRKYISVTANTKPSYTSLQFNVEVTEQ